MTPWRVPETSRLYLVFNSPNHRMPTLLQFQNGRLLPFQNDVLDNGSLNNVSGIIIWTDSICNLLPLPKVD